MPTDLLARPDVRVDEVAENDDDLQHVFCDCRPTVSLCGVFDDGPWADRCAPEDTCDECLRLEVEGCPGCGCRAGASCRRCDTRPWWRRWLS